MARKKKVTADEIGHPDYLPAQLIAGETPEERDAEVAARIKDNLIKLMNSMGSLPDIADGKHIPDVKTMKSHHNILGILIQKLEQRLNERYEEEEEEPPTKTAAKKKSAAKKRASINNEFD